MTELLINKTRRALLRIMNTKKTIFFVLVFAFYIPTADADLNLVPAHLLKWPETGVDYAILVDKSTQKVLVFQRGHLSKPVKEYRCSTGENSGPKSRKNDKKTPEGIYFFTKSFMKRELSSAYGILAFPLDYPNQMDKKQGRSGYGIWFHGTEEVLKPRDTNGCIVLENRDIKDLASYIRLYETPVIISDKIVLVPHKKLKEDSKNLETIIETWAHAWEKKDIDRYMGIYSQQFSSKGMDYDHWKAYKTRLAKTYGKINVNIENLQLFMANDSILAKFDQTYSTTGFKSQGKKRLYLAKNSDKWRIVGELFSETKEKKMLAFSPSITLQEVRSFVGSWKEAWEQKDLRNYISFYDNNFRSGEMDLRGWEKYKADLNKKYRAIKVEISKIEVVKQSSRKAEVCFEQSYTADAYHDFGIKKLILVKEENHWKIKKETWRPVPVRTKP
jgi:murein L,D-transpeptidase YafK